MTKLCTGCNGTGMGLRYRTMTEIPGSPFNQAPCEKCRGTGELRGSVTQGIVYGLPLSLALWGLLWWIA